METKLKVVPKNEFENVKGIKHNVLLNNCWPAFVTADNELHIELMKGQLVDKKLWNEKVKDMVPIDLRDTINALFNLNWKKYK